MNVLDLFSGIGGFSLGLERAGMRTVAFCEIEPYPRAVLAERWSGVPIYTDVRELTAARLTTDGIGVDLICGGFPCQDISVAGRRAGIGGERSGLWSEYARLVSEIRPRFVIVENVAALLGRGIERVLGDLSEIGYDAEWHVISAADVGAPHLRERVWIVAYPRCKRDESKRVSGVGAGAASEVQGEVGQQRLRVEITDCCEDVADSDDQRLQGRLSEILRECAEQRFAWAGESWGKRGQWLVEPDVGRVAHGVPSRVDRLKSLGNAVVPQIPEIIGRAILKCATP